MKEMKLSVNSMHTQPNPFDYMRLLFIAPHFNSDTIYHRIIR